MHKVIRTTPEFKEIYSTGSKLIFPYFSVYYTKHSEGGIYFGITVSKKIGNAVIRNRVKRRFRAMLTAAFPKISTETNLKIVVVARKYAIKADFEKMVQTIKSIKFYSTTLQKTANHEAN